MTEIFHAVSRSEVPFQHFRIQVALEVGGVVGPFGLENATIIGKYSGFTQWYHNYIQCTYSQDCE